MNNISRFTLQTSVAGIFSLGAPVRIWVCCGATVLKCCQCNWGPSLTEGTALVSNVALQQTLEYSKSRYISRNSDWSQLIKCADLILWLQSAIEVEELQYLIPQCANCFGMLCGTVLQEYGWYTWVPQTYASELSGRILNLYLEKAWCCLSIGCVRLNCRAKSRS